MVNFYLDKIKTPTGPVEWEELEALASFNDEEIAAVVEISQATFSGEEFERIDEWVKDGLSGNRGLYQGMPFEIELINESSSRNVFEGYLNFKESYNRIHDCLVSTKINSNDDILSIQERLQSINFGLLLDQGFITKKDFIKEPFIVEKFEQGVEFALLSFATFMTLKETIEGVLRIGHSIVNIVKATTPNVGFPSVDLGDIIAAILIVILDAIYVALMIIYLISLIRDLIDFIYPPIREHLGMRVRVMLEKAAEKLGFILDTGIVELDSLNYIPSRPDENEDRSGIPRPEDTGYNCSEIYGIVKRLFKARIAIDGNKLILRAENDPFWLKQSTYELPDVLHTSVEFNTNEVIGNKLLSFETDSIDAWTSVNYKGTSYSIRTLAKNGANEELINGFERIDFGVALGTKKEGLNDFENTLKVLARLIDGLVRTFGGKSNLAKRIDSRVGMLKQSERVHSVPKIIRHDLSGKLVPRDLFSAKYLYDNYHNYTSFVVNNFFGQKRVFNNVTIKFCIEDFIKTTKNSYFTTHDGRIGKFTELRYAFSKDSAVVSYWIREVHSKNLIEEYAEPE